MVRRACFLLLGLVLSVVLAACALFPVKYPEYRALLSEGKTAVGKTVFRDARVFTAVDGTVLEHQDVWVSGSTIEELVPTDPSRTAEVEIDARGKTLMPGLVDMHVHTTATSWPPWYLAMPDTKHTLEAFLYSGITTVNDLGGALDEVGTLRNEVADGKRQGPRIFFAGPIITARGGYPASLISEYGVLAQAAVTDKICTQVTTPREATEAVLRRVSGGATIIKIVVADIPSGAPRLTEETIAAVVKEAHAHGLKVAAHIDDASDALLCAKLGVDLLAHGVITSALTPEEAKTLAAAKIVMVPTMVNYERFAQIAQKRYTPLQLTIDTEPKASLEQFAPKYVDAAVLTPGFFKWGDEIEAHVKTRPVNVKTALEAGVQIAVGSDAMGSVGTFAPDIHHELELLVAAGMPNADALMGATSRAAKVLMDKPHFGTIEVGKSADLLLVDGDPLTDISATQKLVVVMARGKTVQRNLPK
ncbi:MAG: amidohydrolase family protein [Archangium sp.]|nr:amidohydrolase family protein [Archangium sp.]